MKQGSSKTAVRTGRPLGFSPEQSIDAAMNLFWSKGVSAVTSKDLADAMGIQRSSFYNSFGSKEAVWRAALEHYAEIAPDRRLDDIGPGQPVAPALVAFFGELCDLRARDSEARGCLVCNRVSELAGRKDAASRQLRERVKRRIEHSRQLFEQAQAQGEIPATQAPCGLARSFVAFLIGLNALSKVERDRAKLWTACRSYLQGVGIKAD